MTTDSYTFDPGVFDDAKSRFQINAAVEGVDIPGFPWNHPAVKFAKWYKDTFGNKPNSSEEWRLHGDAYNAAKDYATVGTDDSANNDADVLASYVNSNSTDTTGTTGTTGTTTTTGTTDTTGTTGTTYSDADYFPEGWRVDLDGEFWTDPLTREIWKYLGDDTWEYAGGGDGPEVDGPEVDGPEVDGPEVDGPEVDVPEVDNTVIDDIKVVAKKPSGIGQIGELVRWAGVVYIYDALGGWIPSPDHIPGGPADNSVLPNIMSTATQPDSMWSGIDWSSLLSGVGDITGLASLLGWEGLGGGDEDNWFDKLIDLVAAKNAYEEGYKYEVPTGQMASQSEIGKQWGLPSREDMVMQGMGPNYLQDQQYAMPKGTTMPAATHVSGNPLLKEIEGGKQGGIMGLKSHGDITPAFLEPGEFVFTKKATDNMGAKRLYKLMQQAEQMGMN